MAAGLDLLDSDGARNQRHGDATARACSVIANGGLLVKPKLILKQQRPGGEMREVKSPPPVRIIKPETAFTMRRMMEGVMCCRTARAQYGAACRLQLGRQNRARRRFTTSRRSITRNHYNASFMGFAPVTNPAIVVVVTLNGTTATPGYGGARGRAGVSQRGAGSAAGAGCAQRYSGVRSRLGR